ncbi:hypothetical protein A4X06_0g6410 [Tilletia controversa]|uniref:Uncharacterized protein n=1 Tax=Tilletia controversa TaxID=13291 RepID=A0A8X7SV04_9BASI|nr:hypothetical protein A4X06_0g6410 [Tilletia controversa]
MNNELLFSSASSLTDDSYQLRSVNRFSASESHSGVHSKNGDPSLFFLFSASTHHAAQRLRGLGVQAGPVRAAAAFAAEPSHDSSLTAIAARHQTPEATNIKFHKVSIYHLP